MSSTSRPEAAWTARYLLQSDPAKTPQRQRRRHHPPHPPPRDQRQPPSRQPAGDPDPLRRRRWVEPLHGAPSRRCAATSP